MLREAIGFSEHDQATMDVGPIRLLQILFRHSSQKIYIVSLPTSVRFDAVSDGAARRQTFEISRLHNATVDGSGRVLLIDGLRLRSWRRLPLVPSELDWRIVHLDHIGMARNSAVTADCRASPRAAF